LSTRAPKKYTLLGLMSGTSLDGLDLALVTFWQQADAWHYMLEAGRTVPYPESLKTSLANSPTMSGEELAHLDVRYGQWMGQEAKRFLRRHQVRPKGIASHGYTVFHQPERQLTLQIGNGAAVVAVCDVPVVCDFRRLDVALGGQGAPLVPIGDRLLFGQYAYCVNLGGFSNLSCEQNGQRIAYDVAPCNLPLNRLAETLGKPYDAGGKWAASGRFLPELASKLGSLPFYAQAPPKSLGREWLDEVFWPEVLRAVGSPQDKMHTLCRHLATQLARAVQHSKAGKSILLTGGGAKNSFLVQCIREALGEEFLVYLPRVEVLDFKEALIFAFLGLLRLQGKTNTLASATGAKTNSVGGVIYG